MSFQYSLVIADSNITRRGNMAQKRILLIEPEKEQSELFANWLREEDYQVKSTEQSQEVLTRLQREHFDLVIIYLDFPGSTQDPFQLCRKLKEDPRLSDLPIAALTFKHDGKKIAAALEAGVDSFVLKPFETDSFLERIKTIFREIELKAQGRKALDLNYINYLIKLVGETSREDFFLLSPIIFNKLIMDKVNDILGEPTIMVIIKRVQELTDDNYGFMKQAKFQNGQLLMDDVDKVSKDVPVKRLSFGFQDFVYAFLHLVKTLTSDILMERGS